MDLFQRHAQLHRDVEKVVQRQCGLRRRPARRHLRLQDLVERLAAGIFEDHRPAPAAQLQRQWMRHPRMAAAARDRILALELRNLLKRGERLIGLLDDQRGAIRSPGPINP
ncbi:hypothetical protein D3C72_848480 [compost metagenome]